MRLIATRLPLLLAASATIVVCKDETTTGSSAVSTGSSNICAAQNVVDECVQNMKFQLENCATYDWDCQCIGGTNVVNCYNNCPEHPDRIGAQTIRQQNCANAKAYATTTTAATLSATATDSKYTNWMSASSSAYGSDSTGTPSGLKSNNNDDDSDSSAGPTKSLTGLEASSSPSQGAAAAAVQAAGGWVAFLGLALGVLF